MFLYNNVVSSAYLSFTEELVNLQHRSYSAGRESTTELRDL